MFSFISFVGDLNLFISLSSLTTLIETSNVELKLISNQFAVNKTSFMFNNNANKRDKKEI